MTSAPDDDLVLCHKCGAELRRGVGDFFVVRIEAFADPSPPVITAEDLRRDTRAEIQRLIHSMSQLSEQELMDQVYRRLTLHLCNTCYTASHK
jgi:hypothetical protein